MDYYYGYFSLGYDTFISLLDIVYEPNKIVDENKISLKWKI